MDIFIPHLTKPPKRIVKPEEVGATVDDLGKWHFTMANQPTIQLMRGPLTVRCGKCEGSRTFMKSGPLRGWSPPTALRRMWLCPRCTT